MLEHKFQGGGGGFGCWFTAIHILAKDHGTLSVLGAKNGGNCRLESYLPK